MDGTHRLNNDVHSAVGALPAVVAAADRTVVLRGTHRNPSGRRIGASSASLPTWGGAERRASGELRSPSLTFLRVCPREFQALAARGREFKKELGRFVNEL